MIELDRVSGGVALNLDTADFDEPKPRIGDTPRPVVESEQLFEGDALSELTRESFCDEVFDDELLGRKFLTAA